MPPLPCHHSGPTLLISLMLLSLHLIPSHSFASASDAQIIHPHTHFVLIVLGYIQAVPPSFSHSLDPHCACIVVFCPATLLHVDSYLSLPDRISSCHARRLVASSRIV